MLVAYGAPLAARTHEVAGAIMAAGWDVNVVATRSAMDWIDEGALRDTVGAPARVDYRSPEQPKRGPRPSAVIMCPGTFNSVNKLAGGMADTYALGVLCEALGSGVPILAVPMVNNFLWGHPAWMDTLERLTHAGVSFIDVRTGRPGSAAVPSGTGDEVVARFDPSWITDPLSKLEQTS